MRDLNPNDAPRMTGPEHYRDAEELLYVTANLPDGHPHLAAGLAAAQVHATLALAAATAFPATLRYLGDEERVSREWANATGA